MDSIYAFLRKSMGWTQASVVSRFNNYEYFEPPMPIGITEQFLRRVEMGMVSTEDHAPLTRFWEHVDYKLREHLIEYREMLLNEAAGVDAPILPVDTQAPSIAGLFESWITVERYGLRQRVGTLTAMHTTDGLLYTPKAVDRLIEDVTTLFKEPNTVYAFCRDLKLHLFIVQRWKTRGGTMPVGVREALSDAGIIKED